MTTNVQNKTDYSKDPRWQKVADEKAKGDACDKKAWEHIDKAVDAVADKHFGTARAEAVKSFEASSEAKKHYDNSNEKALEINRDASRENCTIC